MNENHESNEDLGDGDPQNEEPNDQGKRNEEAEKDDDIPIYQYHEEYYWRCYQVSREICRKVSGEYW